MELFEAITNRQSIRNFKKQALPEGTVEKLLESATLAPSAGNVQPWHFIVARDEETRSALAKAAYGQKYIEDAPVVIVVCADEAGAQNSYGERGKTLYCLQDTAAAIQNILLTAYSLSLGTCWIGAFREDDIRKVIKAPDYMRPVALVPVGISNELPSRRHRRQINEIMHWESF